MKKIGLATLFVGSLIPLALLFASTADAKPGGSSLAAGEQFERVIYVDYGQPFHGGPPPHTATDAATDFRLAQGGMRWFGAPKTVEYSVDATGCADDCASAGVAVNAGFDAWQVSGITYTQDNASPDGNPCGGSNSVTWASIDGAGGILALTAVCRNVATKEIVGFTMTFDSGDTWSNGGDAGKFDIQATAAHEAGHVTGPDHVNRPAASRLTMFFTATTGDTGPRTLGCGDRLAVNALYGTSLDCTGLPGD